MKLNKKKIVLLSSSLEGGGSEGVCVNIANTFINQGWQVDLIVLNLKNGVFRNRLSKEINLIDFNLNHARYSFIPLSNYIFKNKPKLIFVFNYELAVILVILRFFIKLKIKIIARNTSTFSIRINEYKKKNIWARYIISPLIEHFYKKADHIVNQCNGMLNDLINVHPEIKLKSSVINNSIPNNIQAYVDLNNINQIKRKNYLLCVGRLEEVKAYHYAIEAFAKIAGKFPNLRLKFVGDGSLKNNLKQKATELSILNRIDFEGFQNNIIPYYLGAKATILTSLYEGYPNILIESIALGTPVVAFNCKSGPNEIIKNNVNGYLVKHLDVKDLTDKLSKVLTSSFKRKNIIQTLEKNQNKYVSKKYKNLIESLILN